MADGWADLGTMLAGGAGRAAEAEYLPRLKQNYDAFSALEEAKIKRSQAMARESIPEAFKNAGLTDLHANVALAGDSVDMRRLGDFQDPNYLLARQAALAASGLAGGETRLGDMNTALILAEGRPVPVQRSMGSGSYTPNAYDPNSEVQLTKLGETQAGLNKEKIGTEATRQGANEALTGQRNEAAKTAADRRENPDKYRAPPKAGKSKVPRVGEVKNGYRFKGGDPNKKSNWEKV